MLLIKSSSETGLKGAGFENVGLKGVGLSGVCEVCIGERGDGELGRERRLSVSFRLWFRSVSSSTWSAKS